MERNEVAKTFAGIINDIYGPTFKLVERECNDPIGMERNEVAKTFAGIINNSYGPTFKLVELECNKSSNYIC